MTDHDILQLMEKRKAWLQSDLDDNDVNMWECKDLVTRRKLKAVSFGMMHRIDELTKIISIIREEKARIRQAAEQKIWRCTEEE